MNGLKIEKLDCYCEKSKVQIEAKLKFKPFDKENK